ncbi:DmX-like protein 1 [Linum perenne]
MAETNYSYSPQPELLQQQPPQKQAVDIIDPIDHLPLRLLRSDTVAPAPNRSISAIDWLPDFSGHSWLAYGASSLLVISHFPSSPQQVLIGPVLRQVFELSGSPSSPVASVSWSPVTPSIGEVAAGADNSVFLFSHNSAGSKGSFCWSQNAVLVQSTKVEAISWTGSGDGIVVGGTVLTLWRRKNRYWEIAWKFKRNLPQNLVSATWSIDGLFAAAAYPGELCSDGEDSANKSVTVCYSTGTSEYATIELVHPQHVSLIQWRPLACRQTDTGAKHLMRHVLLTSCLDGTVRLWAEAGDRMAREFNEADSGQESQCRTFSVAAVIEINKTLNGRLGVDIFLRWATEVDGFCRNQQGANQFFDDGDGNDKVGACEWLIGFGPGKSVAFWAVHGLDDISPSRSPHVKFWRRQDLQDLEARHDCMDDSANFKDWILLRNVVYSKHHFHAPPNVCSLIHCEPCDAIVWSMLHSQPQNATENGSSDNLKMNDIISCSGHSGRILQLVIHPRIYEVELAASLDSKGLLIFWSVSALVDNDFSLSALNPTWKVCGKLATHVLHARYTSIRWSPCLSREERFLLLGHAGGIDCFLVQTSRTGNQEIQCHRICTIPFTGHSAREDGPVEVFSIPLSSTCKQFKRFLVLGVWMKKFQALSWEVILHSSANLEGEEYKFDDRKSEMHFTWKFESTFCGKQYFLGVGPCSSHFPEPHSQNEVTSYSILCDDSMIPMLESSGLDDDPYSEPPYLLATGCIDGSVKLWRSISCEQSTSGMPWQLVGDFIAHQGPVSSISLAANGRKIATACIGNQTNRNCVILVWDIIRLPGTGKFLLEDELVVDEDVVDLSWLSLGNGQHILGACTQNQLLVYAQKRSVCHSSMDRRKSLDRNWSCIAVTRTLAPICDFIWGPHVSAVVVHDNYFNVISQWSVLLDGKPQGNFHHSLREEYQLQNAQDSLCSLFVDDYGCSFEEFSSIHMQIKARCDLLSSNITLTKARLGGGSSSIFGSWSLVDVVDKLRGALPVYHPEVLLSNIYSGNWKRAYVSVQHLVEHLASSSCEKKCDTADHGYSVPQIPLPAYFEGHLSKDSTDKEFQWSSDSALPASQTFVFNSNFDSPNLMSSSSSKSEISSYVESLEKSNELTGLTNIEKLQLVAIVDLLGEVKQSNSAYKDLDGPGRRFWVALIYQRLHFLRSFGRLPSVDELVTDSRMIGWAFHSDCDETLVTCFLPSEPTWNEMRALGFGFWFTNDTQLRKMMEKLARSQYLKKKDPKDCALLYIALNRLQVLAGLFKISKDEKDKPLVAFLSRNFQEEKNKAAALKNAYVLMGRHQIELAIAFFLLGGDTSSAISVCIKNLRDEQLALVICRLIESRGGPLHHHVITKFILPSAVEKGDSWTVSLLEWELGNYSQSFLRMVDLTMGSTVNKTSFWSNHAAFEDPDVGLFCFFLTTRNSMKNTIGEQNAAILSRWATFLAATAFCRCGLPLEALECLSSSTVSATDQGTLSNGGQAQTPEELQALFSTDPFNWLSSDVASYMESITKLDLSLQYLSTLAREHPSWHGTAVDSAGPPQHDKSMEVFREKLYAGLASFEQKFSVSSSSVIKMVVVWLCNNGLWFTGCDILLDHASPSHLQDEAYTVDGSNRHPILYNLLCRAIDGTSLVLSRFIVSCNITFYSQKLSDIKNEEFVEVTSIFSNLLRLYLQGITDKVSGLRYALRLFSRRSSMDIRKSLAILDLFEYYMHFASAWFQHSSKGLLLMVQPLLITCTDGHTPYEVDTRNLKSILHHISELLACNLSTNDSGSGHEDDKHVPCGQNGKKLPTLSNDEKWIAIGVCLWLHMSKLMKHKLHVLSIKLDHDCSAGQISSPPCSIAKIGSDGSNINERPGDFSPILAKLLDASLAHISSLHVKLLGSFLQQEVKKRLPVPLITWLEDSHGAHAKISFQDVSADVLNSKDEASTLDILWASCADPKIISEGFVQENLDLRQFFDLKRSVSWIDLYKGTSEDRKLLGVSDHDAKLSSSVVNDEDGFSVKDLFTNFLNLLSSWQKDTVISPKISNFRNAREVHRQEGELLEALCMNSNSKGEAALASSQKGIVFFNWADSTPRSRDQPHYLWSEVDWPPHGCADDESTPVPTFVSPDVGLVKAAGLGGEVQVDQEESVYQPATAKDISSRAISSHPSRPLFLVGSSNTHIYLWKYGKEIAAATYGALPAGNLHPQYALASIAALQFDNSGDGFVSAALDGTVCSWQVEARGNSPTVSSLCFNSHALDVTYVGSSGSVVAAAGYSSNGANVVMWDTLAPPNTTSRTPILCHEGGARSISAFDNDFGSGSISPLIVTGGKYGDVGLHDLRYITTGRSIQFSASSSSSNGMLWYVPKAHLGSITTISTVPQTSLFLTGSNDGDVKLWDAKAAKLVHHWPKLHERRTFVQPSSRGHSGVVRAGVTDIQVVPHGFVTCGGDGSVKLVQLGDLTQEDSNETR